MVQIKLIPDQQFSNLPVKWYITLSFVRNRFSGHI